MKVGKDALTRSLRVHFHKDTATGSLDFDVEDATEAGSGVTDAIGECQVPVGVVISVVKDVFEEEVIG